MNKDFIDEFIIDMVLHGIHAIMLGRPYLLEYKEILYREKNQYLLTFLIDYYIKELILRSQIFNNNPFLKEKDKYIFCEGGIDPPYGALTTSPTSFSNVQPLMVYVVVVDILLYDHPLLFV